MTNLYRLIFELFKINSSISRIQALNCPDDSINAALVDISIKCSEISSRASELFNATSEL